MNVKHILANLRGLGPRHKKMWPCMETGSLVVSEGFRDKAECDHGEVKREGARR